MSDTIFELDGLYVTRLVGPVDEGEDRRRWEFYTPTAVARLTADELRDLIYALQVSIGDLVGGGSSELAESTAEQRVADAARAMFEAVARCEQEGGDPNRAFLAAIPPEALAEAKRQMPFLSFLGL